MPVKEFPLPGPFQKKNINIRYFPHPIIPVPQKQPSTKEIDVLIWGAITPYKGIDKFLEFSV